MLQCSGFCLVVSPLYFVPCFGVLEFGGLYWVAELLPLCVGVLDIVFLVLQSFSCFSFLRGVVLGW